MSLTSPLQKACIYRGLPLSLFTELSRGLQRRRQFELFHPSSRFRLSPFVLRYALRAPSAYPSRAIR